MTTGPRAGAARRLWAQARLCGRFYLGLGARRVRASYPECRVRAARGCEPELIRGLVALRRGESREGEVEEVNFRCRAITPAGGEQRFFFKDFPRKHVLHDVERAFRCSRVDRAWRGAHLLPRLGILTPAPVGTAFARVDGRPTEYLVTEWVQHTVPYYLRLREARDEERRARMLGEFARQMRCWHDCGVYLRDLVKNVLTRESPEGMQYWLTDLDQLHPRKLLTRGRALQQMRQLAYWSGPLTGDEAEAIVVSYLGAGGSGIARAMREALLTTRHIDAL